jgi:DNA-binding PadR family transcriptional regulator
LVRYGVLGLLIERRGYGYELVQRLRARLGGAWQLNASAVYTALDQLEAEGLIEPAPADEAALAPEVGGRAAARRVSRRAARVVYRATDAGRRALEQWMAQPAPRVEPVRSVLALKVALASPDRVPALLASICHEERLILDALGERSWAPAAAAAAADRHGGVGALPAGRWSAAAAALVNAAAVSRLQAELAWLGAVREVVERLLDEDLAATPVLAVAAAAKASACL